MTWTTLAEEATLLAQLGDTERAEVDVVGSSVEGRPIRAVRLGDPPPTVGTRVGAFMTGLYHGNEPSGREALLRVAAGFALPERWLELTGSSGDYASTPDHASLDLAGDIDIRIDMVTDQFGVNTGSARYLVSKYTTTGDQRAYSLRISGAGNLQMAVSTTGANALVETADAQPTPNPLTGRISVRCTVDVDDGDGNSIWTFYESRTIGGGLAGPWTQLGTAQIRSSTVEPNASTAVLEIGSHTEGTAGLGGMERVYAAQVRDGINGTIVAHPIFDEADGETGEVTDSAGRDWTVHGSATIEDPTIPTLPPGGLVIVPTVNIDGFPDTRLNANGEDANTTHVSLPESTPETRAVSTVLQWAQPVALLDLHESTNVDPDDVQFAAASNPMTDADVITEAGDIVTALKARITGEGFTPGDWPAGTAVRTIRNSAGLRNIIPVLAEMNRTDQTASGEAQRSEWAWFVLDEFLDYVATNFSALETVADDAATAQAARGAAGVDAFELVPTTTLDPPPLGYQLSFSAQIGSTFHRQVWNVDSSGNIVTMGQPAYGIIPYLLDEDAELAPVEGTRLFVLPTPVVPPDLDLIASVIAGSHEPLFEARVLSTFQFGGDPDGELIDVLGGGVVLDGTADVRGTLDLGTIGHRLFPRRSGDLLLPDGQEVFVRRGIDLGTSIVWVPLGYYRIETPEQQDAPDGPIRISGFDRMKSIIDSQLLQPRSFAASATYADVFATLVGDVYPLATILFDDEDLAQTPIGRLLVVERSRYEPLKTLVNGRGKIMFWDGEGQLRIESAPDPSTPVWEAKSGRDGVLTTASRRMTRADVINAVVVRSQGADDQAPARAVAIDDGPNSITRFGGRFGAVPEFLTLPAVASRAEIAEAARETLLRRAGLPYQLEFATVPNPALVPYDPVRVTLRDGTREQHVLERLDIPLETRAQMRARTREQRESRVVIQPV